MKAIVLAAGLARRMQPLSDHTHKALLPVGGTTILGRLMEGLLASGIDEIVVVTGYRADDVRAFLTEAYPSARFEFVHNARFAETNNIVSLSLALDQIVLDGDVVLTECDLLCEPSVLARLVAAPGGNIALVGPYRSGMDGTVVSVENGVVTHVYPPHLQGRDFNYVDKFKTLNIYRFEGEFCRTVLQPLLYCYANLIDSNCYYELVLGMLINMQRQRIDAIKVEDASWVEVDDPNDLAIARFVFERDRRAEILDAASGGHWNFDVVDFAFMRNAYFPTDAMLAAMREALPALTRSYGSRQAIVNEKLALALRCRADRLQTLHGASQVFPILEAMFGDRTALVPDPTFGEYARAFPRRIIYLDAPGIDLDSLASQIDACDVVVAVTPNGQTGSTIPAAWLHTAAAGRADRFFIVDDSFGAFDEGESMIEWLEREPLANVLVVRSLSKVWGAPGLRLGLAYSCDPSLIDAIGRRLPIWNLGAPAEFLLELVPKCRTELADSLARTRADRRWLADALSHVPFVQHVYPSGGNFLVARLAGPPALAADVRRRLLSDHRIDIKDLSGRFGDDGAYIRVGLRTSAECERLVEALVRVAADVAVEV